MISIHKIKGGKLVQLDKPEKGCWMNIYPPFDHDQLEILSKDYGVPLDFLTDSLDIDERSRYEREEDIDLIVLNTPIRNDGKLQNDAIYVTIPIGIISTPDIIITISSYENPVIDRFLSDTVKNFDPSDHSKFSLQIFERNAYFFLYFLKDMNYMRNAFEKELYNSSRNKDLNSLLNIQKSLVYFATNLRANELLLMKIQRVDFLKIKQDEDKVDFLQDVIVDNTQAIEMSDVYTNILNGTMDAFASIISNNLNTVMKRLTSVTIILMLPTLIASFYGMNVKLPLQNHGFAFLLIMIFSILLSAFFAYIFIKRRWF